MHQFVVMVHTLDSHIAALSHFSASLAGKYRSDEFNEVIESVIEDLRNTIASLQDHQSAPTPGEHKPSVLDARVKELVSARKRELQQGLVDTETRIRLSEFKPIVDQFLFISAISGDLEKLSAELS